MAQHLAKRGLAQVDDLGVGSVAHALALDLQHIRAWWAAADIVYRSRKEDVTTYASIDHIGDTLDSRMDGLSPEQRGLIGIWTLVDERVWSEKRRDMDKTAKAAQAAHPIAP